MIWSNRMTVMLASASAGANSRTSSAAVVSFPGIATVFPASILARERRLARRPAVRIRDRALLRSEAGSSCREDGRAHGTRPSRRRVRLEARSDSACRCLRIARRPAARQESCPSTHGVKMNVSFGHGEYGERQRLHGRLSSSFSATVCAASAASLIRHLLAIAILDEIADAAHLEKRHVVQRAHMRGRRAFHRLAERAKPLVQLIAQRPDAGHVRQRQKRSGARHQRSADPGGAGHQRRVERKVVEARRRGRLSPRSRGIPISSIGCQPSTRQHAEVAVDFGVREQHRIRPEYRPARTRRRCRSE